LLILVSDCSRIPLLSNYWLFDLLGIGRAALADMTWTKLYYEVYVFISLVSFILLLVCLAIVYI
ncbi:MAG: hypothetical protein ACJ0RM_02495, partial [Alphaproteobacteria bacterium]